MLRTSIVLLCLLMAPQGPAPGAVICEAYAVRFGILPAFSVANLVAGAERGPTLNIPVMVWLLKGFDTASSRFAAEQDSHSRILRLDC